MMLGQVVSDLEIFKMGDSPARRNEFDIIGKENLPHDPAPLAESFANNVKASLDEIVKKEDNKKTVVSSGIKLEEANEPLLQENPHRFVLFPIKYHEVSIHKRCTLECFLVD